MSGRDEAYVPCPDCAARFHGDVDCSTTCATCNGAHRVAASSPSVKPTLRVKVVLGTRRREWLIVNRLDGCVDRFKGTQRQAEARASELERAK